MQAWQNLGDDIPVKRETIRLVADIKLLRTGLKGERHTFSRHRLACR
ncbi:hypothetical protein [Micromonospora chalcea]